MDFWRLYSLGVELLNSRAEWRNLTSTYWKMKTEFTQGMEKGADILTSYENSYLGA